MSDRFDTCRLSTTELTPAQVTHRVNNITVAKLDEVKWFFGKEPYCRAAPAPAVSLQLAAFFFSFAFFCLNSRRPRLQRFPSQQTHDGPHPQNLMPDWLVSDGEDEEGVEHLEGTGVGESGSAGESLNSYPLHEWPDDDVDDLNHAYGAAYPAASTDIGPVVRKWLRKVTDTALTGEQATEERPHGKQAVGPQPAEKRVAGAQPAEEPTPKKIRVAGHGPSGSRKVPKQPAGRKRPVPMSAG